MTKDLFDSDSAQRGGDIDLPGATLRLISEFLTPTEADAYLAALLGETAWQQSEVLVWGKWHQQPRLVAWYGEKDATYSYSGTRMNPLPWTSRLAGLRHRVEEACNAMFNSVLLNLYRDHNDRMGWHSDNEPELGPTPTIASVSIGSTRDLLFKHRNEKQFGIRRIGLTHGSLLVMSGQTQRNWLHAINREAQPVGSRINLTFRRVIKQ